MSEKVNILIVDDLPDKLLAFQSILDELQENLVLVRSGREALQKLLDDDFAVILLDVNMPDMDGLETAKLIRQYRRTKQTPIVFITSYMDDFQSLRGYALGAVDYISVPVVPEILRSKIKVFVDLYRMHNQLRRQAEEREALARAEAARDASELARRRADLLADASYILTRSLDIDAIVGGLLNFTLAHFANIALVMLFHDDRRVSRASLALAQSGGQIRLAELDGISPQLLLAIAGIDIKDDLVDLDDAGEVNIENRNELGKKTLALRSAKLMPLFGRGKLIGAIVLADAKSTVRDAGSASANPSPKEDSSPKEYSSLQENNSFKEDSLLMEIASRSAIAIENALLYSAIRDGDRHKNEFLAMLSHELRNPLAPIRNAVHILQMRADSADKVRWASEIISRQVEHMAHIMNDLLDVSRIARGIVAIEQRRLVLSEVIDRAVETCNPLLDDSGHRLSISLPEDEIELHGDLVRLSQIFSNLIHNAIKYSPAGSDIGVRAVYGADEVSISVSDNGNGISPELLPHVFELFVQGDISIDRQQSGLGVGLTLVKHLTALHQGHIEARSEGVGKGAEFIVRLPACRAAPSAQSSAAAEVHAATLRTGRVLVVDDLEESAASMRLLLEMQGYEAIAVHDGPSALNAVSQFHPDVVLLDIGLPGMDGYEVSRQLHKNLGTATPFIIALTGYGQESDRESAAEAGIDAHVVKPADIDELLLKISNFCTARARIRNKSEVA